jgi:hypothetical protein
MVVNDNVIDENCSCISDYVAFGTIINVNTTNPCTFPSSSPLLNRVGNNSSIIANKNTLDLHNSNGNRVTIVNDNNFWIMLYN